MSMLSAQSDELRKAAQTYRGLGNHRTEQLLLDAADTISELRDRLASDLPRLPHWWTHDGTLHVEAPRLPEGIAVTLPDERDREVRSARVWRYEPVRTASRVIVSNAETDHATGHCECGACGGAIDPWDEWCRHCGARMENE